MSDRDGSGRRYGTVATKFENGEKKRAEEDEDELQLTGVVEARRLIVEISLEKETTQIK
jgi:hypothetical protein